MLQKNRNTHSEHVKTDQFGAVLLDARRVAGLLGCSTRTIYRLSDAGKMPRPVKLGALVRWSKAAIMEWIEGGCPNCRRRGVAVNG